MMINQFVIKTTFFNFQNRICALKKKKKDSGRMSNVKIRTKKNSSFKRYFIFVKF